MPSRRGPGSPGSSRFRSAARTRGGSPSARGRRRRCRRRRIPAALPGHVEVVAQRRSGPSPAAVGRTVGKRARPRRAPMTPGSMSRSVSMTAVVIGQLLPQSLEQPVGASASTPAATPSRRRRTRKEGGVEGRRNGASVYPRAIHYRNRGAGRVIAGTHSFIGPPDRRARACGGARRDRLRAATTVADSFSQHPSPRAVGQQRRRDGERRRRRATGERAHPRRRRRKRHVVLVGASLSASWRGEYLALPVRRRHLDARAVGLDRDRPVLIGPVDARVRPFQPPMASGVGWPYSFTHARPRSPPACGATARRNRRRRVAAAVVRDLQDLRRQARAGRPAASARSAARRPPRTARRRAGSRAGPPRCSRSRPSASARWADRAAPAA